MISMKARTGWLRYLQSDLVAVARHEGVTLVTDRYALWEADSLRAIPEVRLPAVPEQDGDYTVDGKGFTPEPHGVCGAGAEALLGLYRSGVAAAIHTAWLTEWDNGVVRVGVTAAGRPFTLDVDIAERIDAAAMWLRATDDPQRPLALFRPTERDCRSVGLIQPHPWADDPLIAAIAADAHRRYDANLD